MKKLGDLICKKKNLILIITVLLIIPSLIGMKVTKINYDILVYLPEDIETVKGQNILSEDFNMGAFSITIINNMASKDILKLEKQIKEIDGVAKVISGYDVIGNTIPLEMLPSDISEKISKDNSDLLMITYNDSTSSKKTLDAVEEVKKITENKCKIGGMSAVVLDTMELSETEILIYIVIAVILCIIILELSLDSYFVPVLLLTNIGVAILFNLGTNVIFGEISYITKALVAVLQLGVTTDFSIFLYHSYESKKEKYNTKEEAMSKAIHETFVSVAGSSLTTIAGFLVLCTMKLTLGKDLGLVMAKGVLIGVITVLTVFPSLLLFFDKLIEKTKHKKLLPKFKHLSTLVVKKYKILFIIFIILLVPAYLANSKVEVYYKLDESLPKDLDSIVANKELADKYNIVSPEIILLNKNITANDVNKMISDIESIDGIDFVLSFSKLSDFGISKNLLSNDVISIFESDKYQMILINSTYQIATNELNRQISNVQNIIKKYDDSAMLAGEGPLMKDLVTISDTDFKNVNTLSIVCILIIMLFVLKSYTLPILLILTIEFAIFINMAIPYFSNEALPFVASIVLGTIQLGATIDYAILMTTTYLNNRKQDKDKQIAMKDTLNSCISSIIVSGLCFFGATFGVGIYSKLEMISSLCTLISRGAIISMLVVIMILPAILLIFDKTICKTTFGFKKEEKNMKNKLKKVTMVMLIVYFIFSSTPVYALTKDETVYAKLNSNGSYKNIIVNEHLINNLNQDELEDITDLQNILNINGNEKFVRKDNSLTWIAGGNDIFYQGTIKKELPISLHIKYYLNGEEKVLDDIIGKSGRITIKIKYQNNDRHYVNLNGKHELLYTPFIVTTGTIIDNKNNSNIEVTNGKTINNGTKNMVIGISAPGLYESLNLPFLKDLDEVTINFDTQKFELASIYSVFTPKIIDSDDLKIFDKMDLLYDNVNTLSGSMNEIKEGIDTLTEGASKIDNGASQIYQNLELIENKMEEVETGIISVDDGLKQILQKLKETKELLNNTNSEDEMAKIEYLINLNDIGIEKLVEANNILKTNYDNFGLKDLTSKIIMAFTAETYKSFGLDNLTDDEVLEMNIKLLTIKNTYETSYNENQTLIELLNGDNSAIKKMADSITSTKGEIDTLIVTLEKYITEIELGTSTLSNGMAQIKEGTKLLTGKTNELWNGTTKIYNGTSELSEGITKFNDDGISKINNYINGNVKSIESKVNALIELGEDYDTFTMKSKENEGKTKFILVVDSVKVKEQQKDFTKEKVKDSFWARIKNLFK